MTGHSHRPGESTMARLLIILFSVTLILGCGGPQAPQESPEDEPAPLPEVPEEVTLEASEALEAPTASDALVVYASGEVVQVTGGDVRDLAIGDTVGEEAVIRVEAESYAEIQVGDRALLRVEENTQITLNQLQVSENRMRATTTVTEGSLMSRVERLTGRDSFSVRTDGVVAGVRGTRFRVQVTPEGESTIAVEEGRVSLLPPTVDLDLLIEQYGEEAQTFSDLAPVVDEAQQVTVGREQLQPVAEELTEALTAAEGEAVGRAFESAGASLARETPPADRINPESRRALRDLGAQQLVPLRTEAQPTLLPLTLTAEPPNARIIVTTPAGRELISRGRFSGLFEEGQRVAVTVRADGYETRELDLTMEADRGYSATITLPESPEQADTEEQPEREDAEEAEAGAEEQTADEETAAAEQPEPELSLEPRQDLNLPQPVFLTVLTRPGGARILRNGEEIGVGSAFIESEVGEEVSVTAQLEGYTSAARTVAVTAEMDPLIEIPLEAQVVTERITVVTEPSSAQISLNGEPVGRGRFSETYETGRQLTFSADAEGYFPTERSITVRSGAGGTYRLRLEEEPRIKDITIVANPPTTRITVNRRFAGRGRHTARYEWGEELVVELSAPGYISDSETITVREEGPSRFSFSLEPEPQFATLTVSLVPGDGELSINGTSLDAAEVTREFEEGTQITVAAERRGFRPREERLTLEEDTTLELRLEPEPIEREVDFGGAAVIRGVEILGTLGEGGGVLFADARGRVYRYDLRGREIWNYESKNRPNENSLPVVTDGIVLFTGASEAVALSTETGEVLYSRSLGESSSHLFGRTVTPLGDGRVLFPDNGGITVIRAESGEIAGRIPLAGGARSSAAVNDEGEAVVVDQGGVFHLLDPDAYEILSSVSSGLVQPVAAKPAVSGSIAVAVDRRGNAAAVNLREGAILWERTVAERGLFSDPIATRGSVYFTAGESLYAVDLENGENRFSPIAEATTPPAYIAGAIYVGRGTVLTEVDPVSGSIRREIDLGAEITGRPAAVGELVIAGTADGTFVMVNRTAWEAAELSD